MTTIQKFTEDLELLTDRANVICISDEAHRSQINLDQKVKVTAEGAETDEQVNFLKSVNCDFIQGYYYSKPVPQDVFENMLDEL